MNLKEISILVITETIPIRIRYTFRLPKDISILATTQKFIHKTMIKEGFSTCPPPSYDANDWNSKAMVRKIHIKEEDSVYFSVFNDG